MASLELELALERRVRRPHLGFFQHRPSTEARLLDLPGLRSVDDFLNPPREQSFDGKSVTSVRF